MATIRDVARASGVSVTTVSVVLNNTPKPVNSDTRQRVLAVARHLNYHPNSVARSLVRSKTHSLGILNGTVETTYFKNYFASGVLDGVFYEADRCQYDIHLFVTRWVDAQTSAAEIRAKRTDGTLILIPLVGSDMASGLTWAGQRCVAVSAPSGVDVVPYVDVDNVKGTVLAVEHLIALGHERIAHLYGSDNQDSMMTRYRTFGDVLRKAELPVREEYLVGGSFQEEAVAQTAYQLLTLPERPTAIFASNDSIACTVLKVAKQLKIQVPEDLSIVGFDNVPLAEYANPPITTVEQPLFEIGRDATRLLIDMVEGRPVTPGARLHEPKLLVRGTTAPLQKK